MDRGRRKYATLFASIMVLVLLRLLVSVDPIKQFGAYITRPFSSLISSISYNPDQSGQEAKEDVNVELANELDVLEAQNQSLKNQLNFVEEAQFEVVSAEIIGKSSQSYRKSVTINAGSSSGIEPDMAVMFDGQLVGIVHTVQANTSSLLMIGDPDFRAAAEVVGVDAIGIVTTKAGAAILDQVSVFDQNVTGKKVVTSGLGGLYPPNIPIGTVGHDLSSESAVFKEFALNSGVRVDQLTQVVVVVGYVSSP